MDELLDSLLERYEYAKTTRSQYDGTLSEIGKYMWPLMQDVVHSTKTDSGDMVRTVDVYDTTAIFSTSRMASGILGNMMPFGQQWFSLAAEEDDLNKDNVTKILLSERTSLVHRKLLESKFTSSVFNVLRSAVTFTFGCLGVSKKDDRYNFKFIPISNVFFECNSDGDVDTVFYIMNYNARQARQEFGDIPLGKTIDDALISKSTTKYDFVHCVFPNDDYDGKYGSKKFASKIINLEDKEFIDSEKYRNGYNSLPYKIVKFAKGRSDDIGDSPSVDVLPTVKECNTATKGFIKICDFAADPVTLVEDESVVSGSVSPGGVLTYRHGAMKPEILKNGQNPSASWEFISQERQLIREFYLLDVFDAIKYYRKETKAEFKEAEIVQRIDEGFVVLAPLITSIEKDLLDNVIMDIYNNMEFDDGLKVKVIYQGRLSLAMKRLEVSAIESHLARWAPYQPLHPVYDNMDIDSAFVNTGIDTGVPAKLMRKTKDVTDIRAQRAVPAEAGMQAQIMSDASKAIKNIQGTKYENVL